MMDEETELFLKNLTREMRLLMGLKITRNIFLRSLEEVKNRERLISEMPLKMREIVENEA